MDAVIYTSESGFTKHYAELLGERLALPVYALGAKDAPASGRIVYLGWLMAGQIKGLRRAEKRYRTAAVCAVGMGAPGSQPPETVRKQNSIPAETGVFYLQGGFDITKLHGLHRFMMKTMSRVVGKKLAAKPDRTPEEDEMLDMMVNGGDCVDAAALDGVVSWLASRA